MPHLIPIVIGSAGALTLAVIGLQFEEPEAAPSASEVAMSLGFTPQTCTLAGLTAAETSEALGLLTSATTLRGRLAETTAELDAAMTRFTLAKQAVMRGLRDDRHRNELSLAETALEDAQSAHAEAKGVLSALLMTGCNETHLERFVNCAGSAGFDVPDEYRVLGYSDEAWEEVAAARRQQRRIEAGVFAEADADLSAIAAIDADSSVVEARGRLNAHYADVARAFTGFGSES